MPLRLILADDHPIVLDALEQLFTTNDEFEVVARCSDGDEAIAATARLRPDVLVLDIRMPKKSGLEVLRAIHRDQVPTRVVLLTAELSDDDVLDAVRHGVGGIVLKEAAPRQLVQCVRTVAEGRQFVDSSSIRRALDRILRREAGIAETAKVLSPRELEILRMAATGLRNRQIGEKLTISEATVKIHLHSIYQKLGVSGRVELAIYARDKLLV